MRFMTAFSIHSRRRAREIGDSDGVDRERTAMSNPPGFFQGTEMPTAGWWEALWPDPAKVLAAVGVAGGISVPDRKSTRLNSSHLGISYAVFCLKKKTTRYI